MEKKKKLKQFYKKKQKNKLTNNKIKKTTFNNLDLNLIPYFP